jgi:PPK2 family polyphosphate:nucleotide phosphotransferase
MHRHRIESASGFRLSDHDPGDLGGFTGDKSEGKEALKGVTKRLEELQELLYASNKHRILVVLQATDTGGKDGTIRHVFEGVNPQGVKVASFKRPTEQELARDYLWRVHQQVPANGEIVIFNRSHYEDVLVVRVQSLAPEPRWARRYDHINDFERMLADEGTTILKFFLHISKDEQAARLRSRLEQPEKQWKFEEGDLIERAKWDDYQMAFQDAIARTSTPWAPWYVVPSNHKWYRNVVIGTVLVETLEGLDMDYPKPQEGLERIVVE